MNYRDAMKRWIFEVKPLVALLLPWIAAVVTVLPFNRRLSRFLDRLLVASEGE